jgi:hypothetical protein
MSRSGENPGRGYYKCRECGRVIRLRTDGDCLPRCPVCWNREWAELHVGPCSEAKAGPERRACA